LAVLCRVNLSKMAASTFKALLNYIDGEWCASHATEFLNVVNPATAEVLTKVPLSPQSDVNAAATAAATAYHSWRRVPPTERVQYLFKLKFLLEEHLDELAPHNYLGMRENL
jgi:malonate-semialdehyde dehydrogenase (acetylating)/methylmalonate-semialdehyde dehydrogenase